MRIKSRKSTIFPSLVAMVAIILCSTPAMATGTFSDIYASPALAAQGTQVTISFATSQNAPGVAVTVDSHYATYVSGYPSGPWYYHYTIQSSDADGAATIYITAYGFTPASDTTHLTVDKTAPTMTSVTDDGDYTADDETLYASWSGSDATSGIAEYQYGIGTSAGATNTVGWTSTGTTAYVTKTGLSLSSGQIYYFTVKAQDGAGNWSSVANSDGITVDTVVPTMGSVTDDGDYTISTTELHATWSGSDALSGIAEYKYAIGTTSGGTDIRSWTSVGNVTEYTATSLTLSSGTTYYFSVMAKDGVGNWSDGLSANGIMVDATPPSTPSVTTDICTSSLTSLTASWSSSDSESNISEYEYAIGTSPTDPGAGYLVSWTSAGTNTGINRNDLTLQDGYTYYFYVKAENGAELWSTVGVSGGITANEEYAETGKGYVNRDLLGGIGGFDITGDVKFEQWTENPDSWFQEQDSNVGSYVGGSQPPTTTDQTGVGWFRLFRMGNYDDNQAASDVYSFLVESDGQYTSNCQYFGIEVPSWASTSTWIKAAVEKQFTIDDNAAYALHHGDTVRLTIDRVHMVGYHGDEVTYDFGLHCLPASGGDETWDGYSIGWSADPVNVSHDFTVPDYVNSASAKRLRVYVRLIADCAPIDADPGMFIDGVHLYVKRAGQSEFEKELIPAPKNRNIRTDYFISPYSAYLDYIDPYAVASNYDSVVATDWSFPFAYQLRHYNPDMKIYVYRTACIHDDFATGGFDKHSDSFMRLSDADPDWEYLDGNNEPASMAEGLYYAKQGNEDFQTAWADLATTQAEVYGGLLTEGPRGINGFFFDCVGAQAADGAYTGGTPVETQSFLHNVLPSIRTNDLEVIQNACCVVLATGLDVNYSAAQYPGRRYKEGGLIAFDPDWTPYTGQPRDTDDYTEDNGYTSNSVGGTPDALYQEWAFFTTDGSNNFNEYDSYWLDCIAEMDWVNNWNSDNPTEHPKSIYMNIKGYNTTQVTGLDGWAHFALCSYLLAQSQNTALEIAERTGSGPYIDRLTGTDFGLVNALGDPSGSHGPVNPNDNKLQVRYYDNGLVVVNGDPSASKIFTPSTDIYEEQTGDEYGPNGTSSITLLPHTGRIFFSNP